MLSIVLAIYLYWPHVLINFTHMLRVYLKQSVRETAKIFFKRTYNWSYAMYVLRIWWSLPIWHFGRCPSASYCIGISRVYAWGIRIHRGWKNSFSFSTYGNFERDTSGKAQPGYLAPSIRHCGRTFAQMRNSFSNRIPRETSNLLTINFIHESNNTRITYEYIINFQDSRNTFCRNRIILFIT